MKREILSMFTAAIVLTATGCVPPDNGSNSSSQSSSTSSTSSSQQSSSPSTTSQSSTTSSTKPKEEMRPEVQALLIKLESLKKSANEKYTEMESKYGSVSKFPSSDIKEWNNRLTEYQACLKELRAFDLNSAEWDYYERISDIRLLP